MTLRLPQDKLCDIRRCLVGISRAPKITKRQLQSLIGKLNWATQVIHVGRLHLQHLLDRISGLRYPSHRIRVTRDMRADIAWWLGFMDCFNGLTKMVNTRPTAPLAIDACSEAAGAYYMGHAVHALEKVLA